MIPANMPEDFRKSQGAEACGNCGQYSNRRSFCNIYRAFGVKDIYVCNKWRRRFFTR